MICRVRAAAEGNQAQKKKSDVPHNDLLRRFRKIATRQEKSDGQSLAPPARAVKMKEFAMEARFCARSAVWGGLPPPSPPRCGRRINYGFYAPSLSRQQCHHAAAARGF